MKVCPSCSAHLEDSAEFCPFDGHRLVADTSDVSFIGATLADRWHVERKLGQGPVGTVYRAEDAGRSAAVKILNPAFGPGSDEVGRMLAEARRGTALRNPNLVPVLADGVHADRFVFVVEPLLAGQSLEHRLEQHGPLRAADAVRVALEILAALDALHRAELVHLDVKPQNIFLVQDPLGMERAALAAVGTRHLLGFEHAPGRTRGTCLARAEYVAPEVVGGKPADARADVYLIGVVLYEMLTGRPPFTGGNFTTTTKRHVYEKPLSLKLVRPQARIADNLEALVLRCLNKSAAARYESAEALALALEKLAQEGDGRTRSSAAFRSLSTPAPEPARPAEPERETRATLPFVPAIGRDEARVPVDNEPPAESAATDAAAPASPTDGQGGGVSLRKATDDGTAVAAATASFAAIDVPAPANATPEQPSPTSTVSFEAIDVPAFAGDTPEQPSPTSTVSFEAIDVPAFAGDTPEQPAPAMTASFEAIAEPAAPGLPAPAAAASEPADAAPAPAAAASAPADAAPAPAATASEPAASEPAPAAAASEPASASADAGSTRPEVTAVETAKASSDDAPTMMMPALATPRTVVLAPPADEAAPTAGASEATDAEDEDAPAASLPDGAEGDDEDDDDAPPAGRDAKANKKKKGKKSRKERRAAREARKGPEPSVPPKPAAAEAASKPVASPPPAVTSTPEAAAKAATPEAKTAAKPASAPPADIGRRSEPKPGKDAGGRKQTQPPSGRPAPAGRGAGDDDWFVENTEQLEARQDTLAGYLPPEEAEDRNLFPFIIAAVAVLLAVFGYVYWPKSEEAVTEQEKPAERPVRAERPKPPAPETAAPSPPASAPEPAAPASVAAPSAPASDAPPTGAAIEAAAREALAARRWTGGDDALASALARLRTTDPKSPAIGELESAATKALLAEGDARQSGGDFEAARAAFRDALAVAPGHAAATVRLAGVDAAEKAAAERAALTARAEAEQAAKHKAAEEARLAAEQKRQTDEAARQRAAEDAKRKADAEAKRKADEARQKADAEAKRKADEARQKADAEAKRKADAEAKRKADAASAAAAPKDDQKQQVRELVSKGQAQVKGRNFGEARKAFHEAIRLDGNSAPAYAGLGEIAFQEQNFSDAVRFNERSVRLAPRNADYLVSLGMAYFKLEKFRDAKAQWEKARSIAPGNAKAAKYLELVEKKLAN